ncbi:hypothetical protein [Geothermobacter ehrlichii]|uniref:hypothetical protein n=1 Tax=Geothermobacter ehrlichii TaxID=213224 RepID=UPI0011E78BA1|nr:hypothetical protein [Geothermobacter ehrlichii]
MKLFDEKEKGIVTLTRQREILRPTVYTSNETKCAIVYHLDTQGDTESGTGRRKRQAYGCDESRPCGCLTPATCFGGHENSAVASDIHGLFREKGRPCSVASAGRENPFFNLSSKTVPGWLKCRQMQGVLRTEK